MLRQNDTGRIYGITYVDHKSKVVFNGSDLGKQYSANAIQERCGVAMKPLEPEQHKQTHSHTGNAAGVMVNSAARINNDSMADALLREEYTGENMPFELRKKKKKKSKGISDH